MARKPAPGTPTTTTPRSAPRQWAYPDVRALFLALIDVQVNLEGLASYIRDDLNGRQSEHWRRWRDPRSYVPPLTVIEQMDGRAPFQMERDLRAKLEATIEVPAIYADPAPDALYILEEIPAHTASLSPPWLRAADAYCDPAQERWTHRQPHDRLRLASNCSGLT